MLALKLEGLFREKAKGKEFERKTTLQKSEKSGCQISDKAIDTKRELAKIAGVSHDTIAKVKVIDSRATPEQKVKVKTGKISINQAFTEIKKEERKEIQKEKRGWRRPRQSIYWRESGGFIKY